MFLTFLYNNIGKNYLNNGSHSAANSTTHQENAAKSSIILKIARNKYPDRQIAPDESGGLPPSEPDEASGDAAPSLGFDGAETGGGGMKKLSGSST